MNRSVKICCLWVILSLVMCQFFVPLHATDTKTNTTSLEFINYSLRDLLRHLAATGGFQVLLGQAVQGEVSLVVQAGMSARDAVKAVASTYGYSVQWFSPPETAVIGASRVLGEDWQENRSWQKLALTKNPAARVAEAVETVIPRFRVKPDLRTNSVSVLANRLEYQNLLEITTVLEQKNVTPVTLDIRLVEIPVSIWKAIGINRNTGRLMGVYPMTAGQCDQLRQSVGFNQLGFQKFTLRENRERLFFGDSFPVITESNRSGRISYRIDYSEIGTEVVVQPVLSLSSSSSLEVRERVIGPKAEHREIRSWVRFGAGEAFLLTGTPGREELQRWGVAPDKYPMLYTLYGNHDKNVAKETVILVTSNMGVMDPAVTAINETPAPTESPDTITAPETAVEGDGLLTGETKPKLELKPTTTSSVAVLGESLLSVVDASFVEIRYVVKSRDTLNGIIKKFATEPHLFIVKNRLGTSGTIKAGLSLIVPVPKERVYILKSKETMWRISKRYGTSLEVLKDLNSLTDVTRVEAGRTIVLPVPVSNVADAWY